MPARLPVHLSIKAQVALTCAALLAVSLGAVGAVVVHSTDREAERSAEALTAQTTRAAAETVQVELGTAFRTARDLGTTLTALQAGGATRAQADGVQRSLLEKHPELLGVWTGWEPGAFDGSDAAHVSRDGSDATGRYVPYWVRTGGVVGETPLVDYDKPGAGDYYVLPSTTGQEKVLDPYAYDVGGTSVLMTSFAVPVREGDRVVGVAGVDMTLDQLQQRLAGIRVSHSGTATLVSGSGSAVASPVADLVGKPVDAQVRSLARAARTGTTTRTVQTAHGAVLRVAAPVVLGTQDTWTLVVDVPQSAVLASARHLRNLILLVCLVSLAVASLAAVALARRLVRPVDALRHRMQQIGEGDGDLTVRVDDSAADEIGALARAFNTFVDKVATTVRQIVVASAELGVSAEQLQDVSARMTASTDATSRSTAGLTAASAHVEQSVQGLALGTQEMGAAAREIAGNASAASQQASTSVQAAHAAAGTITALHTSSSEIGDVVRVITGIAEQTNLLALNATIEAARAGEAGKGFAVVAGEVKELAQETARATEDITRRIAALQADSQRASTAVARIAESIGAVDASQVAIATAVEEQAATVQTIGDTVTQAAEGTSGITSSIAGLDALVSGSSQAAEETSAAAEQLEQVVARLRTLVAGFRC